MELHLAITLETLSYFSLLPFRFPSPSGAVEEPHFHPVVPLVYVGKLSLSLKGWLFLASTNDRSLVLGAIPSFWHSTVCFCSSKHFQTVPRVCGVNFGIFQLAVFFRDESLTIEDMHLPTYLPTVVFKSFFIPQCSRTKELQSRSWLTLSPCLVTANHDFLVLWVRVCGMSVNS